MTRTYQPSFFVPQTEWVVPEELKDLLDSDSYKKLTWSL